MRFAFALFAVLFVAACSSTPSVCDSRSCSGCCTAAGECISGTSAQACGVSGNTCTSCPIGFTCALGACGSSATGGGGGSATGGGGGTSTGGGGGAATGGGGGSATGGGTGSDAGSDVYPDGGSWYRYWDGGSCATKTDCPCFSSDDCGPGFRCVSEDSSGTNVWCKPGARGDGGPGVTCTGEAQCFSALCVSGASSAQYCSGLCDTAADCAPNVPRCQYVGFGVDRSICVP
ncbi:MAG TPA: hypothetical protein VGE37_12400 [Archangium sp.]